MKLDTFFATHPIFTVDDLTQFLGQSDSENPETRQALLRYHQKQGHILRIRRGLYASVPTGFDPRTYPVDPYLLASKLADDAVLAYHTALAFHGIAHSIHWAFTVVSEQPRVRPLRFRNYSLRAVVPPAALQKSGAVSFGVETVERLGQNIRVTSLERTLVDVLDRPVLGGGFEEIWRSLEDVDPLDIDRVVTYAVLLDNATTAAKVGYFLDQHRDELSVTEEHLERLHAHQPRQPRYLRRTSGPARFVATWNLMVPLDVLNQSWQEVL
jgi:predicted transcriptional regulator of viral defense system